MIALDQCFIWAITSGEIKMSLRLSISLCLALTGAAVAEPLVVATEASFPPFSQTEADGSYTGFEIDLGNAVCAAAGFECTWVKQDFDGAIAALNASQFDLIFSSMSIKPEREEVADFSLPYYTGPSAFFAPAGTEGEAGSWVEGRVIGVYAGSTQDAYMRANFPAAEVRGYENIDQIGADLVAGRIDGMFVEELAGLGFLAGADGAAFMKLEPIFDDAALGAGAGAMMRTGDERLARINEGIRAVYADGTFAALEDKWLPEGATIAADHLWPAQ
jgi:ABC-type amino acid transport substrate-binding protein